MALLPYLFTLLDTRWKPSSLCQGDGPAQRPAPTSGPFVGATLCGCPVPCGKACSDAGFLLLWPCYFGTGRRRGRPYVMAWVFRRRAGTEAILRMQAGPYETAWCASGPFVGATLCGCPIPCGTSYRRHWPPTPPALVFGERAGTEAGPYQTALVRRLPV